MISTSFSNNIQVNFSEPEINPNKIGSIENESTKSQNQVLMEEKNANISGNINALQENKKNTPKTFDPYTIHSFPGNCELSLTNKQKPSNERNVENEIIEELQEMENMSEEIQRNNSAQINAISNENGNFVACEINKTFPLPPSNEEQYSNLRSNISNKNDILTAAIEQIGKFKNF